MTWEPDNRDWREQPPLVGGEYSVTVERPAEPGDAYRVVFAGVESGGGARATWVSADSRRQLFRLGWVLIREAIRG